MIDEFSTFVMSETTLNQIKVLPPETQLRFFWAVANYGVDGIEPDFTGLELAIWIPMKFTIDTQSVGAPVGRKHWNWKGGISPENHRIRESALYKQWVRLVFFRDKYTCQSCGKRGGKLHAHHIKSFAQHPELRLSLDNGTTYCDGCHRKWHKKHGRVN